MQHRIPLTPAAWSNWLTYEEPNQERHHQHNLILVSDPSQPFTAGSDKENQQPQVNSNSLHLLCLICHGRFIVSAKSQSESDSRSCTGAGYKTHHFHQSGEYSDLCCGCGLELNWDYRDPVVAMSIIENMSDTRKVNITYADYAQGPATVPTVASALATILVYIRDMRTGVRRDINIHNKGFVMRIGADSSSIQLFGILGFKLEDAALVSTLGEAPEDMLLLQIVRQEIEATLASIRSPHGHLSIPDEKIVPHFESATTALETFLAAQYERRTVTSTIAINAITEFSMLGVVPDMADNVIVWVYKCLVNEQPQNHSGWLEALEKIAHETRSEELQTEVAIEHSQGVFGFTDVSRAYQHFDIADPQNVDDDLILGLYDIKMTDEPNSMKVHLDMLRVIANNRQSDKLFNLLSAVSGYTRPNKPEVDEKENEATSAVPSPSTKEIAFSETPVGLNNIGNTCYLNSLLQYYFTLKELRDTVLDMDQYVEHEEDPEWEEKRIGGIKVGHNEVRLAKQFVALLRELFLNLTHTQDVSIAPQENLAYMALTSADEIANSSDNLPDFTKPQLSSGGTNPIGPVNAAVGVEPNSKQDLEAVAEEEETMTSDSQSNAEVPEAMDVLADESDPATVDSSSVTSEADATAPTLNGNDISEDDNMKVEAEEDTPLGDEQEHQHLEQDEAPQFDEPVHQSSQLRSIPSTETLATTGSQATINETVDIPPLPERRPAPPPPSYLSSEGKGKVTESINPFEPAVRAQDPTKMLFGRQQDVTECMGNCMYFFEAALRPAASDESSSEEKADLVKELFYGKARQILSYNNEETNQLVTKVKEEEFSHLIVDAAEGKNLYDGLDEYFFADKVDDYQGGNCAVREVAVTHFPPILQVQVQRVQFDRRSARVYKSNAFVQFDETIYLDRYLDSNFDALADRRKQVTECRKEIDTYKADIAELTENKKYPMPVVHLLEVTTKILQDNQTNSNISAQDYEKVMCILEDEIRAVKSKIGDRESKIESLTQEVSTKYDDLQECKYQLHAVFIHQGQANYGHYWIYIRDHVGNKWWKYNDTNVSEVNEAEIFKDTTGSTANPYFLVYVRSSDLAKHVMTICRKKLSQ